jgi:hypothetical protein
MKTRAVDVRFDDPDGVAVASVSIQRTAESRYIACACGSAVSLYSRASKRLVNRFAVEGAAVTATSFSPHHINVLVAADNSGCVTVWDITHAKPASSSACSAAPPLARFPCPARAPATDIAFSPSAPSPFAFCVSGLDKNVRFFARDAVYRQLYTLSCSAPVTSVAIAPDASTVAAGTSTGAIVTYRLCAAADSPSLSHSLVSEIAAAHAVSAPHDGDATPRTPAVRSLHYRPALGPTLPPPLSSTSSRAAAVAAATAAEAAASGLPRAAAAASTHGSVRPALRHAVAAASSSAPPRSSVDPHTPTWTLGADGTPPRLCHAPRDSDIFSPVPAAGNAVATSTPTVRGGGNSIGRGFFDSDDDDDDSVGAASAGTGSSPSASWLEQPEGNLAARRDTLFIPARQADAAGATPKDGGHLGGESSVTSADPLFDGSECDNAGRDAALPGLTTNTFVDAEAAVTAAAAAVPDSASDGDVRTPRDVHVPPACEGELAPGSRGRVKPGSGQASRSSSDMNRRRLPPLPPRSLSDDAMAAHLRAAGPSSAVRSAKNGPRRDVGPGEGVAAPSVAHGLAPDSGTPTTAASAGRADLAAGVAGVPDERMLRRVVADEVGVATADLRSDIKNLHTELVLSLSRQEESFRRLLDDKDKKVAELEVVVKQLRLENKQLRGTGRKAKPPVPAWM